MTMSLFMGLLAYLLGSLSGSLLLGRFRGVDIRTQGSGNAGGTNALRTQGWKFALGVVLIDVGKGVLAVWLTRRVLGDDPPWPLYAAIMAAVIGHVWPVFHGFRGGKGLATLLGGLLVAWPLSVLVMLGVWLLTLTLTGYVGLASILAAFSLIATALVGADSPTRLIFSALAALTILYTHRSNVARLRAGCEHRFERVRIFARLFARFFSGKPA
jgi:glycerol-3-phosphate acyltransferase PlsY